MCPRQRQRRRAAAEPALVGVQGRDGGGHRHGHHPPAPDRLRGATVRVSQRHGLVRLHVRAVKWDPGHMQQFRRVRLLAT